MLIARSKRDEALQLTEELLGDIEFRRIGAPDVAMKASRLARLLDDVEALSWLRFEVSGYPPGDLDEEATRAALRSNRLARHEGQTAKFWTTSLGALAASNETAMTQLSGASAAPPATGEYALLVESGRQKERASLAESARTSRQIADRVVGTIHDYASQRYQELRFGAVAESAFEVVRKSVDSAIGTLIPDALPAFAAAYENASSDSPEHWSNAASTCRRLLKLAADRLQPAGSDVERSGRIIKMGDGNYVNRLAVWIQDNLASATQAELVMAELNHLGHRMDAVDAAGQKGAHATVTQYEASRFLISTYLLLGDLLRLTASTSPASAGMPAKAEEAPLVVPASPLNTDGT